MFSNKTQTQLTELAKGFDDGTCLLDSAEWLGKHDISLTDCMALSSAIAGCIYVATQLDPKTFGYMLGLAAIAEAKRK